ncbi:hypothetical protein J2Y66_000328 [Paenarthrobacter nitroguajacolicus]|uniref:DUF4245 domain-containing protein n=1 Tax=Paenarthrobacter nitroguajacolicus TaxID=211146 RepID=UPI00285E2E4B|nr:DUF4245 domain-containing protein [Paenarthrobacter nitroguajacolicus]MDR6985865.1 hypothetical protein [Paenarthrobacter nitroguajacolicus]
MSETQDKSPADSQPDAAPAHPTDAPVIPDAPYKPVIAAKAAKRANASVIGMVIALLLCVLAFLPIVLMNPAPKSEGFRPNVDVSAIARNAAGVAGFTPATPDTGAAFRPNYARWESGTGSGVPTWEVGFLTPKEAFIGLTQTAQANPTWVLQQTDNLPVTGTRNAGGQDWELRDSGKEKRSMVLEYRGTTIILSGTASLDEFATLAAAVVKSVEQAPLPSAPATPSAQPSA